MTDSCISVKNEDLIPLSFPYHTRLFGNITYMDLVLQIRGGLFYLINKICFALAEGKEKK